jgi:hypothetical protein
LDCVIGVVFSIFCDEAKNPRGGERRENDEAQTNNDNYKKTLRSLFKTYKTDQMLQQIPLIFTANPPKLVQLPSGFTPVGSVPETQITKENLEAWIHECEQVKKQLKTYGSKEKQEYLQWKDKEQRLAPGYSMTLLPKRTTENFSKLDV